MRFVNLIILSYFMQGLTVQGSLLPRIIIFLCIFYFLQFLYLQEHKLNHRNYSKQEISMELFVSATNTYMNMHAKIQIICKHRYL
jgi:hypothetical protein